MGLWAIPVAVLQSVPCLFLAWKIFSQPHLHTLFNINTALLFLILGNIVFGRITQPMPKALHGQAKQ